MYTSYQDDNIEISKDDSSFFHHGHKYTNNKTIIISIISGILLIGFVGSLMFHTDTSVMTTTLVSKHKDAMHEIESVNNHYVKMLNKLLKNNITTSRYEDWATLMEWYAPDVRTEIQGMKPIHGRDELINTYQSMVNTFASAVAYVDEVDELVVTSDTTAYATGRATTYDTDGNIFMQVKYIQIWVKHDKRWSVAAEVNVPIKHNEKKN